jgi:cytoskeleton protein RodZ
MNETATLPDATVAPLAPGAQLAAAREMSGLTVVDVARQLKLSPWQVEALESGDHRRLPGAVFVRGFIRNYARVVKLDAAPLLANTDACAPRAASICPSVAPSADIPFPTGREFKWQKYAIAVIAVVVPLVIFEFYLGDDAPDADVNSRQVALPAPQVVAQPPPAPAEDTAATAAAPAAAESSPPPAAGSDATTRASVQSAGPAASAGRKLDEQLVRFRFAQASWVEIRDRDGRKIFSQFNPAGTEQVVSGLPPLTLVVGNAKGVGLTYNEQPVDLAPHTKVDVARLTLE